MDVSNILTAVAAYICRHSIEKPLDRTISSRNAAPMVHIGERFSVQLGSFLKESKFHIAGILSAFLLALSLGLMGCGESASPFGGGSDSVAEEAAETAEDLQVRTLAPQLDEAKKSLASRYDGFLEREPLGFGPSVWDAISEDIQDRVVDFDSIRSAFREGRWQDGFQYTLPLWITILFIVVLAIIDRPAMRVARRWQARVHIGSNHLLTEMTRALIVVAGRCFSVGLMVLISYFPIQAVFEQAPWSRVATRILWLIIAYRALEAVVVVVFGLGIVIVKDEHARQLRSFATWAFRLIFAWLGLLYAMELLDWHDEVRAFGRVAFRSMLVIIPLYLYACRDAVSDLFPDPSGTTIYASFRRFITRNYYPILTVTLFLLALRAVGFSRASNFILIRGYAIVGLILFALVSAAKAHAWLMRRREGVDTREQRELFRSLTYLLRVAGSLALLWAVLRLVALWVPLVAVLKTPLVSIGGNHLSVFKVISAFLVLGGAVLLGRLLRAILLLKVYPTLKVDVGVGYAVNTLINYALIVLGFFFAITALGVDLSALTVVLASLGVGIGFGLQTITENLISGFILLFGRSVKKGDIITAGDLYGRVEEVGARSVLVKTPDNYDLLIPSKEIVGSRIVNWSYHDSLVRLHIPVGVTYKANPREVEKILLEAAGEHDHVLEEPGPEVWLLEFGDSSVNFTLLVYYDCRQITKERLVGQMNFIIWDKLAENDIEIPFPQRDLHIRSGEVVEPLAKAVMEKLSADVRTLEQASESEPETLAAESDDEEPDDVEAEDVEAESGAEAEADADDASENEQAND